MTCMVMQPPRRWTYRHLAWRRRGAGTATWRMTLARSAKMASTGRRPPGVSSVKESMKYEITLFRKSISNGFKQGIQRSLYRLCMARGQKILERLCIDDKCRAFGEWLWRMKDRGGDEGATVGIRKEGACMDTLMQMTCRLRQDKKWSRATIRIAGVSLIYRIKWWKTAVH